MSTEADRTTNLLRQFGRGEAGAGDKLATLVYGRLKKIAHNCLVGERRNHTLESADIVGMAYKRIFRGAAVNPKDKAHFFAIAATQIRRVLIEYARARRGATRHRDKAVQLGDLVIAAPQPLHHMEVIHELLNRLAQENPEAARVTEMKFFAGQTDEEVAAALSISQSSVRRHWVFAREWLKKEMMAEPAE